MAEQAEEASTKPEEPNVAPAVGQNGAGKVGHLIKMEQTKWVISPGRCKKKRHLFNFMSLCRG
jgi:hypothetical protein